MAQSMRILVVEDEAIIALDIQKAVADSGHAVVGIATTCEEALRLAEDRRPDIVLMDYNLKGQLNGATAAGELKSSEVRIIFLTAHLAEAVGEVGGTAFDFLSKPVRRDDLRRMLASLPPQHT